MKPLLLSLLLLGACAGTRTQNVRASADDAPVQATASTCNPDGCRVTVECSDHGTCIITCYEADGSIRCQEEVPCDAQPCCKK